MNDNLALFLDPIATDYRTAVCPFIDVVDYNNFEYRHSSFVK